MGDGDEFLRFFLKFAGCQGDIFWNIYANCQKFMIFNSITKAYYYSIVNCREGTYVGRIVLWSSWCILPLFNHQWHTDFLYCYSKVNDNVAVKVEIISNINIIITSKYFLKHNNFRRRRHETHQPINSTALQDEGELLPVSNNNVPCNEYQELGELAVEIYDIVE